MFKFLQDFEFKKKILSGLYCHLGRSREIFVKQVKISPVGRNGIDRMFELLSYVFLAGELDE